MRSRMLTRWRGLFEELGAKGNPDEIYHRLAYYYMQPCRPYHNLSGHISDCLTSFEEVRSLCPNPNEVELAIWFHDAIYETWAADNEHRSGLLAHFFITKLMGLNPMLGTKVYHLILTTKHRMPPEQLNHDAKILVDIDLVSLGVHPTQFEINCQNIRTEYSWVKPENNYRRERADILEKFLRKNSIYSTLYFQEKYETQARLNLKKEIQRLRTEKDSEF